MSCAIEMIPKLIIDDDEKGYREWETGEDIHLILNDGSSVFGEIKEILFTELTILDKDDNGIIVSFEEIEEYV